MAEPGDWGLARRWQSLETPRQPENLSAIPRTVSNSLFCISAKPINIKGIPACEEGDQVPLHHGRDTCQRAPTPTKAMSKARADLLSLDAICTIIKYKIKSKSVSQYHVSPQGQFLLWAADPAKLLEPGWKFNL